MIELATYTKETALYDPGAVGGAINDAGSKATNYLTNITGGGVYVHSAETEANGVRITDSVDIIRNGESVANFGEDGTSRVGSETGGNVLTESDKITFRDKLEELLSFEVSNSSESRTARIKRIIEYDPFDVSTMISGLELFAVSKMGNVEDTAIIGIGANAHEKNQGGTGSFVIMMADVVGCSGHLSARGFSDLTGQLYGQSAITSWSTPNTSISGQTVCNIVSGGYFIEGKHVYIQAAIRLTSALSAGSSRTILYFPLSTMITNVPLSAGSTGYNSHSCMLVRGEDYTVTAAVLKANSNISTSDTVYISGHYVLR